MPRKERKPLPNPNPRNDWKKGDRCWFYDHESDRVVDAELASAGEGDNTTITWYDGKFNHARTIPTGLLFPDFASAMSAMTAYHDGIFQEYRNSMEDPEDVVKFAWNKLIEKSGPDVDPEAIAAFKDRVEYCFGIKL